MPLRNLIPVASCVLLATRLMLPGQGVFKDLRLPMEYYPDGTVKSELTAREAVVDANGTIHATDLRIRFFSEDGTLETLMEAASGTGHRDAQHATSDSALSLTHAELHLTGVGFTWHADRQYVHIHSEAKLRFAHAALAADRIGNTPGRHAGKPDEHTVITSREMTFAYEAGNVWFIGEVTLVNNAIAVQSETLLVRLDAKGDIERAEAAGAVSIRQDDRRGYCDSALYTFPDGQIVMRGFEDPARPRPARLMLGVDTLSGNTIRIYTDREKVVCIPGKLVIFRDENPESTASNTLEP